MNPTSIVLNVCIATLIGIFTERLVNHLWPSKSQIRYIIALVVSVVVLIVGYTLLNSQPDGTVTRGQVQQWTVGETDKDTVYDIIYSQVHIIPGKHLFASGDTIPTGVLITTDLGNNWDDYPVKNIARNGGRGVFETLASFKTPATGEYWGIVP